MKYTEGRRKESSVQTWKIVLWALKMFLEGEKFQACGSIEGPLSVWLGPRRWFWRTSHAWRVGVGRFKRDTSVFWNVEHCHLHVMPGTPQNSSLPTSVPHMRSRRERWNYRHFCFPHVQLILADGTCRHHHILFAPSFKRNTLENQRLFCLLGFWFWGCGKHSYPLCVHYPNVFTWIILDEWFLCVCVSSSCTNMLRLGLS